MYNRMQELFKRIREVEIQYQEGLIVEDEAMSLILQAVNDIATNINTDAKQALKVSNIILEYFGDVNNE